MEKIYSIAFLIPGILGLIFSYFFIKNPSFARKYVELSPKMWVWRKLFGVEKMTIISRKIFIPFAAVLSLGFVIFGVVILFV